MTKNELVVNNGGEMVASANDGGVRLGSLVMTDPGQVVVMARKIAEPLAELIETKRLYATISGRKHVYVEGWATCGAMLGVVPQLESEEESVTNPGEFIATVVAVRAEDGMVLGRAKASCGPDEPTWKSRSRQARRSMAQTRATGKVFRLLFSWVMNLAGYETTPFEELDGEVRDPHPPVDRDPNAPKQPPRAQRPPKPDRGFVTADLIKTLHSDWTAFYGEAETFPEWVQRVAKRTFAVNKAAEWTWADFDACDAVRNKALGLSKE
jgi:hypothetical protein